MNKLFVTCLFFLFSLHLCAGELLLADATGGAPIEAVFQASVTLAVEGKIEVSMKRLNPTEALTELDRGRLDAVIIDSAFAANRSVVPLASEALALYVSSANPAKELTKKQAGEILRSPRPSWVDYTRINLDIQRIIMKPLTPSGTLIRRIFGNDAADLRIGGAKLPRSGHGGIAQTGGLVRFGFADPLFGADQSVIFGVLFAVYFPGHQTVKGVLKTGAAVRPHGLSDQAAFHKPILIQIILIEKNLIS